MSGVIRTQLLLLAGSTDVLFILRVVVESSSGDNDNVDIILP